MNKELILMIVLIGMVFIGLFSALGYGIHQAGECKKAAIDKGMNYLEIKELCR